MNDTQNTKWVEEALKEAQQASDGIQPIIVNITINDNSIIDNRAINITHTPQSLRKLAAVCTPYRPEMFSAITGRYLGRDGDYQADLRQNDINNAGGY